MKPIFASLLFSISSFIAYSQTFSPLASDIVDVYGSNVEWCDFDFDGDYDFIISGKQYTGTIGISYGGITVIYENVGDSFSIYDTLNAYEDGGLVIRDFNGDNVSDVLSSGFIELYEYEVERHSDIYLNYSGFDFDLDLSANLCGLSDGTAAADDLDNDGDIDVVLFGKDINGVYGIRTYINTETGYEEYQLPYADNIRNVKKIEIFDIENDGDNDIIFCGNNLETSIEGFKIYKNNLSLSFDLLDSVVSTEFIPYFNYLGDINSDGLIDVILTTGYNYWYSGYVPNSCAFTNLGNLQFEEISNFSLPICSNGDYAFGDVNNDGQSDILVTGATDQFQAITKLFRNYNGIFTELYFPSYSSLSDGSCSFSDFDNDGDLDFLICGADNADWDLIRTTIYKNNLITKGAEKSLQIPENLSTTISEEEITFSWDPILSPTPHTYNLRVGTTPGGSEIMSAESNLSTGQLNSPRYGNVGFNSTFTLKNITEGTYYWSVQSVNAAYQASTFATGEVAIYTGIFTSSVSATENPVNSGTISGAGVYNNGDNVTLVATANSGFTFVNWTENGMEVSTDETYSFTAMNDISLIANFTLNSYSINAIENPINAGIISGAGSYNHGDNVVLTATSNSGYTFVNWTENGTEVSTDVEYSFTASGEIDLVANFELIISIYEIENKSSISVYPNPISDELIIEVVGNTDKLNFEIFNAIGQSVFEGVINKKAVIQTRSFGSGLYFIKLENGQYVEFMKIIKQ